MLITTDRGSPGTPQWRGYFERGLVLERNRYPANYFAHYTDEGGTRRACFLHQHAVCTCQPDQISSFNTLMDPRTTPFRDGSRQQFGLSVSGGKDRTTYFLHGGPPRRPARATIAGGSSSAAQPATASWAGRSRWKGPAPSIRSPSRTTRW